MGYTLSICDAQGAAIIVFIQLELLPVKLDERKPF
jgi:hypothetical protein